MKSKLETLRLRRMSQVKILFSFVRFIMREPEDVEVEFEEDGEDVVADAGNNADLYAANQGSTELINEAHTEEAPLRFMGQDVFHHQPLIFD